MKLKKIISTKELKDHMEYLSPESALLYTVLCAYVDEDITSEFIMSNWLSLGFESRIKDAWERLLKSNLIVKKKDEYYIRLFNHKRGGKKNEMGEGVKQVIACWSHNPAHINWYNKPHIHKSIRDLQSILGQDKLLKLVRAIIPLANKYRVESNHDEALYIPHIDSPIRLLEKLEVYRQRLANTDFFTRLKYDIKKMNGEEIESEDEVNRLVSQNAHE